MKCNTFQGFLILALLIPCIYCNRVTIGNRSPHLNDRHHQREQIRAPKHEVEQFEWKDNYFQSVKTSDIQDILKRMLAESPYLARHLRRVDKYSSRRSAFNYYWAWSESDCNGLKDSKWLPSNGGALQEVFQTEIARLGAAKIFKEGANDSVAIDIGAHMGDSTIPMAYFAAKTIAFEPSIHTFPFLKANAALNPSLHIDAYNFAVAIEDEEIYLEYGAAAHGGPSHECNGRIHTGPSNVTRPNTVTVKRRSVNLEAFLRREYGEALLSKISYIKVDVEGYDYLILQTLRGLLNSIIKEATREEKAYSLPIIQVEYFRDYYFSDLALAARPTEQNVSFCPGSQLLFGSILDLPGNYSISCAQQCNSHVNCRLPAVKIALDVDANGINGSRRVKRGYIEDSLLPIPQYCEDLLLYPTV